MSSSSRAVGRLLLTGVPGWLTEGVLQSLRESPPPGLTEARCLVEPGRRPAPSETEELPFAITHVEADLRDRSSLLDATGGVDTVLHAAGVLHVRRTQDWYEINTRGTERLLDAAVDNHVERFVFISSNAAAGRSSSRSRLLDRPAAALLLMKTNRST